MPDISLPSGTVRAPRGPGSKGGRGFRGRGQGGGGRAQNRLVAHDIEDARKQRTEDVVTEESREKTFADLLLSAPVLQATKPLQVRATGRGGWLRPQGAAKAGQVT